MEPCIRNATESPYENDVFSSGWTDNQNSDYHKHIHADISFLVYNITDVISPTMTNWGLQGYTLFFLFLLKKT